MISPPKVKLHMLKVILLSNLSIHGINKPLNPLLFSSEITDDFFLPYSLLALSMSSAPV